jgi:hypothetical protein
VSSIVDALKLAGIPVLSVHYDSSFNSVGLLYNVSVRERERAREGQPGVIS